MRGDKFDLNWRDVHDLTTTFQGCCALATDTPTPAVVHDRRTSNKIADGKTQTNQNTHNLGFWKPEMGSLANSASSAEVARAKSNQQNPIYFWWLRGYMRGGEDDQDVVRVISNPRTFPYWAQLDT
jgi:hypothetical protein